VSTGKPLAAELAPRWSSSYKIHWQFGQPMPDRSPTPNIRWYQFSLKGLLWLTLGVSFPLALLKLHNWDRVLVAVVLVILVLVGHDIYRWRRRRFG